MLRLGIWLRITVLLLFLFPFYHLSYPAGFIEVPPVVLFGVRGLLIGQNAIATGAAVVSGADIQIGNNALVQGDVFAEGDLFLFNGAEIDGDVTLGGIATLRKKAAITGDLNENSVELPEVAFPPFEAPAPSEVDIAVPDGETLTLPAGAYRDIEIGAEATLILPGGQYDLVTWTSHPDATLVIDGTVTLILEGPFDLFPNVRVLLNRPALEPSDFVLFVSSAGISKIGQNADFRGLVYAPNGTLHIEQNASATGIFMADEVVVEQNAEVAFSPECLPEPEICDDRIDQDCDRFDLDCRDADQDNDGVTPNEGDCDDFNPAITSAPTFFADADLDSFGDPNSAVVACFQPDGFVSNSLDCNDLNPFVHPGVPEICDGSDDNCDGLADNDAVDASTWYADLDGDGFGNPGSTTTACARPEGFTSDNTDCNDSVSASHPGASEICDTIDNDCDGAVDEAGAVGQVVWFADTDGDGFGNPASTALACIRPGGFVANEEDCNDSSSNIHPAKIEICGDGVDNDCDGIDSKCLDVTVDQDVDGFSISDGDCDDLNDRVFPGAGEFLDSVDNDCDGLTQTIAVTSGNSNFLGEAAEDQAGFRVARAGDVNGDGFGDFLIGAPFHDAGGTDAGKVYLLYGGDNLSVGLSLADADAFLVGEAAGDHFGHTVTGTGDVDKDGFADFLIGAPGPSKVYLILGGEGLTGGLSPSIVYTGDPSSESGASISGAGDVNGDGLADFLIGAPGSTSSAGKTHLIFGSSTPSGGALDTASHAIFIGETAGSRSGSSLSSGDINGDGFSDLLIGAPTFDNGGFGSGKTYLIYGTPALAGPINLSASVGFTDDPANNLSGSAVSATGDINHDGLDDILIGSPGFGNSSGKIGLIYGRPLPFAGGSLPTVADAQFFGGTGSSAGLSLDTAGDVNGDGCDDLLIGAPSDATDTGRAWLVHGGGTGCSRPLITGIFNLASSDFTFVGAQLKAKSGFSVAILGDVNGDGSIDLLIGSPLFDHSHDTGEAALFASAAAGCTITESPEVTCDDGIDQDCDGFDLSCEDVNNDADAFTENQGDCNDTNGGIHPNATELCDSADNNCNCLTTAAQDWTTVATGNGHTLALKSDGTLWAWGRNDESQIGLGGGNISPKRRPKQIGTDTDWTKITAGGKASLAIKSNGTLWGWGDNGFGQTDKVNAKSPKKIGTDADWKEVSTGLNHTAAIKTNGTLWTWGSNDRDQLGYASAPINKTVTQVGADVDWAKVFTGNGVTFAIKTDGSLYAWGDNDHGQLGLGPSAGATVSTPTQVTAVVVTWQAVTLGGGHTIALATNGDLYTWGDNSEEQLGLGTPDGTFNTPQKVSVFANNVAKIAAGWRSSFAVTTDGRLFSWGRKTGSSALVTSINLLGRDGTVADTDPNPTPIGDLGWQDVRAGPFHVIARKATGELFSWGLNFHGELGIGTDPATGAVINAQVPTVIRGGFTSCAPFIDEGFTYNDPIQGELNLGDSCNANTGACTGAGTVECSVNQQSATCRVPGCTNVDNDGDTFTFEQGDCNDNNAAINPNATELCDGIDQNCDGNVDEGLGIIFGTSRFGKAQFGGDCGFSFP